MKTNKGDIMKYLLLLSTLTLIGCGNSTNYVTQNCTVNQTETGATISCPDGTIIELEKETETIIKTVIVNTPRRLCNKREHEHGH